MDKGENAVTKPESTPKGVLIGSCRLSLDSLKYFLESRAIVEVILDTDDLRSAHDFIVNKSPEVVILDEDVSQNPAQFVREMTNQNGSTAMIILGSHSHPSYIFEAIDAGARAYVEKTKIGTLEFASVVKEVLEKNSAVFHIAMDRCSIYDLSSHEHRQKNGVLSNQELNILKHVAQGYSNKQIAKTVYISEQTVKVHLHNIFKKFGACDRAEAVAIGFRKKLLM